MEAPRGLEGIVAEAGKGRGPAPVHLWNPAHCGEIDIVIQRDGTWRHEGSPIGRPALVRLFSTVLRRDPDGFHLVTPVEKLKITVEDAPFIAVAAERRGEDVAFMTNVGDEVVAGPEHPIRLEVSATGEPRPYIRVRGGLDALIARAVFYDLVEWAAEEDGALVLRSGGAAFELGRV